MLNHIQFCNNPARNYATQEKSSPIKETNKSAHIDSRIGLDVYTRTSFKGANINILNINKLLPELEPQKSKLLASIVKDFSELKEVKHICLGGSIASKNNNLKENSDFDLYIYLKNGIKEIPVEKRRKIAEKYADNPEINNQFWETGDEWVDRKTGTPIDIMYRDPKFVEDEIHNKLVNHSANVGYTTCFLHNIKDSVVLYDPQGEFLKLQKKVKVEYPEQLTKSIIAKNYPILRNTTSSYIKQIEKSVSRNDSISTNHRIAALFASYFDIIFAANKTYHPGEKRIIQIIEKNKLETPDNMKENIDEILDKSINDKANLTKSINTLLDNLDKFLAQKKLLVNSAN